MLDVAAALWLAGATLLFDVPDTEGVRHKDTELARHRAAVFFFIAPDCPISNAYAPELIRLYRDYSPRGVAFYGVHSDPAIMLREAQKHRGAYRLPFPVLMDGSRSLARSATATVTPEAAVFLPSG